MSQAPLALVGGDVLVDGSVTRANLTIVDDVIDELGPDVAVPPGALNVDVTGLTLLPGLIDVHTHLIAGVEASDSTLAIEAAENAKGFLRAGITSVRDLGGMRHIDLDLRNSIENNVIAGPTMQCAGRPIVMTGGHCHMFFGPPADGPAEVLKAVREQLLAGADLIKVMCSGGVFEARESESWVQFSEEELRIIIDEAKAQGRPIAVHAHPAEGIKRAVRLGASSIEHASYIDNESADMMAERDVPMVPTFLVYKRLAQHPEVEHLHDRAKRVYESKFDSFANALSRGTPWGVGTDYASRFNEPGDLVEEIEILTTEAGLPIVDVLNATTLTNAKIMGLADQVGVLKPGFRADVIAVDGNPLDNVAALRSVKLTIKGGQVHDWR